FEASLVYRVSSRTTGVTQRKPVLKNRGRERERGQRAFEGTILCSYVTDVMTTCPLTGSVFA
ncbi:hypothetical protein ACQP3C_30730, partial [Escherichia coli]